jgi:hypothetical protein
MRLGKYELSEWKTYGEHGWNHYRESMLVDGNGLIGLCINSSVDFPSKYKSRIWKFETSNDFNFAKPFYHSWYGRDKIYTFDQLEQARCDIDKFIARINNLKSFL